MKNIKIICLLYLLLLMGGTISFKAQAQENKLKLKNFRSGELKNGLQYFIKGLPGTQKVHMRFYIHAGILQQDKEQVQIAHFLEHLAFKPTENLPKSIYHEILKRNMSRSDVSGSTTYRCTRYLFTAPAPDKKTLLLGLEWFKDIAMQLKLTDENIDEERGAVLQEIIGGGTGNRERKHAKKKLEAELFPCRQSTDAILNHVRNFPADMLQKFYKDWYRPDLMGIIITGNIENKGELINLIKSTFNDIPLPSGPRKKRDCDSLYFEQPPQFVNVQIKGNSSAQEKKQVAVNLYFRLPELANTMHTKHGVKKYLAFQLMMRILAERFHQNKRYGLAPFQVFARSTYKNGAFPLSYNIAFKADKPKVEKAFQHVCTTLQQLREYGVLKEEWNRAKKQFLHLDIPENTDYWQRQLERYFVKNDALFANKQAILKTWVRNLSAEEFNALIPDFLFPMPEDIGIMTYSGSEAPKYSESQVRAWIKKANQLPVQPYQLPKVLQQLMKPEEVKDLELVVYEDHACQPNGTRKIVLENGIEVFLKPYQPEGGVLKNEIKLHGFTKHGAACFPKEDYYSALNAGSIIKYMGAGNRKGIAIKSFERKAHILKCTPYIDFQESGIHGLVKPSNAEALMQLIYLYFTKPRFEAQEFGKWKKSSHNNYSLEKNATSDFKDKIRRFFHDSILPPSLGSRGLSATEALKSIEKTNGKQSMQIYRKIFGQPEQFNFVITGDFQMEEMLRLVRKYLGNIPNTVRKWNCEYKPDPCPPLSNGPTTQIIKTKIHQMQSVKYELRFMKTNCQNNPWKETLKIKVLAKLLNIMLQPLRYKKGFALYNFGARGNYNSDYKRHAVIIDINCQAEELKAIRSVCKHILQKIKRGEVEVADFQEAIESIRQRYSQNSLLRQRNLQKLLYEQLRYKKPWIALERYDEFLQELDISEVLQAANRVFKKQHRYEFIMTDQPLKVCHLK